MKLLALDQASRISGYSIFENGELVKYGTVSANQTDLGERLVLIRSRIANLITENNIDTIVMEDIQMQATVGNNVQTFKALAEVFGVIYELCVEMKKPVHAVLSTVWKSGLKIKGRARQEQKDAAANYVLNTFGIKPDQDTCDSICIGAYWLGPELVQSTPVETDFNWE